MSDAIGRKKVIMLGSVVSTLGWLLTILVAHAPRRFFLVDLCGILAG
ncbi:hypothetical protein [Streptococcus equi]|nr:hypothetical protein [Streptococcus equi]